MLPPSDDPLIDVRRANNGDSEWFSRLQHIKGRRKWFSRQSRH
jgi:hypothetical protein